MRRASPIDRPRAGPARVPGPAGAGDPDAEGRLARLGQRLRTARAQRGMTRRRLAEASGVSERFLAQIEGGVANPSVVTLCRIAAALTARVEELLSDAPARRVDHVLLDELLSRLGDARLAEARELVTRRFVGTPGDDGRYVVLLGMRGGGKTTLGRRLARRLGVPFVELDREVERAYGASIGQLLDMHGQAGYLRWERRCLEEAFTAHARAVVEIGGGLATDPEALARLLATGRTVWVKASPREYMERVLRQGDMRPVANNPAAMEDLRAILRAREPFFRQAAIHLDTAGKTEARSFRDLWRALGRPRDPDRKYSAGSPAGTPHPGRTRAPRPR